MREIEFLKKNAIYISALLAALLLFSTPKASASWADGATLSDLPATPPPYSNGNIECSYGSYKSRYIFKERYINTNTLTYDEQTYEQEGRPYDSICMAQNGHGLIGVTNSIWAKDIASNQVLPIDASPYFVQPSPGGKAVLFYGPTSPSGYQYSINHSLEYLGSLSTKTYGTGISARREKIWKINTSKLEPFLQYSDGSIVRIDQVGFSSNGKYMIVQLSRRGFARINVETKELTPFNITTNLSNGIGVFLGISNDGNSAVVSRAGTGLFSAYDLANCQYTFQYGAWPGSGDLTTQGCVQTNLFSTLQSNTPSATSATGFRFSPNGSEFTAYIGYTNAGVISSKQIKFVAKSYASTASGYLALGDSYSSGEGDGQGGDWYEPGTDEQGDKNTFEDRNLCHLSRRSYPYLLAVEAGYLVSNSTSPPVNGLFHSVACSGAKIHNIVGILGEKHDDGTAVDFAVMDNQYRFNPQFSPVEWHPGASKQLNFLNNSVLPSGDRRGSISAEVITVSIGGNDAGFGQKLLACILPGTCEFATNKEKRAAVAIELASLKPRLTNAYKKIKDSAPDARIYVVGYPQFVQASPETCGLNVQLDNQEATFVNNAVGYFNHVIEAAAREAGVVYVDVEDILVNNNLCSGATDDAMTVNGITAGNDRAISPVEDGLLRNGLCLVNECLGSETYHPNQKGHVLYADAIKAQTNSLTLMNPNPETTETPYPNDYFGSTAQAYVNGVNGNFATPETVSQITDLVSGALSYRQPTISAEKFMPYSRVSIEIQSTPVSMGSYDVSATGSVEAQVTIPEDLAPGYHEIHMYGLDAVGQQVHLYQPILVGSSEEDFDGDGVLDVADSCLAVTNSGIDIDVDGIDDACDGSAVPLAQEEVIEPVEEEADPEEEVLVEEENVDNKGVPSPETTAEENQGSGDGTVLGASTSSQTQGVSNVALAATGIATFISITVGLFFMAVTVFVRNSSRKS